MKNTLNTDYFESLWLNDHPFNDRNADFWNLRAEEFNQSVSKNHSVSNREKKVAYFLEKGLIDSKSRALDIGCGTGQLAIALAKVVKEVVAMDFSEKMLDFAKDNARIAGVDNIRFVLSDWESFDLEEPFDLVIASMSPAINGPADLDKMLSASKGSCYLSSFVKRSGAFKEKLYRVTDQVFKPQYNIINYIFNILWTKGYFAELSYEMGNYERLLPLEKAREIYPLELDISESPEKIKTLYAFLDQEEKDGFITEIMNQIRGELIWKVSK